MIAVLFARNDSRYKQLEGYDVYDIDRDARNYNGTNPVIAHPPCRAWGRLSHMANPRPDEKDFTLHVGRCDHVYCRIASADFLRTP